VILKRFSQAIVNQNWSVVVLEIIVVVVGIFLGLQVDDWNEARKYRQQESLYLDKVFDDLTAMRLDLVDSIEGNETRRQRMTAALYTLEACDSSADAQSDVKYALEHYQVSPPINYLDATYSEMVASGSLVRLQDQELKQKISYTYSALEDLNANIRSFRVSMPNVDVIVWRNVSFSVDKDSGRLSATFDIAELCENIEIRNAFVEMIDIQRDGKSAAGRALTQVNDLIALLDANSKI